MINDDFKELIEEAIITLKETNDRIQNSLVTNRRLEKEFEHHVLLALKGSGKQRGFECFASSAHSFPDIVCIHKETGLKFGVEVKTSKSWNVNGNSIFSEIGEKDICDVVVLFCKTTNPVEICWRKYEEVVCSIAITHSPRYMIKMDIDDHFNFFKIMRTSYSEFKVMTVEEKMELVTRYHLKKNKNGREWWMSRIN
jgi:hypothetical protein